MDIDSNFREAMLKKKSVNTVAAYIYDLKNFFDFYQGDITHVKNSDIVDYIKFLDTENKPKSINRKLLSLKRYLQFLKDSDALRPDAEVDINLIKIQKMELLENALEMKDFERLVRAAREKNDKRALAIFYTLQSTGLRVSELLKLKVEHLSESWVNVIGKGNKSRPIYINSKLRVYLKDYVAERRHNPNDSLFLNVMNHNPMNRQSVHAIIKYYAGRCKLKKSKAHAHNFRHLFALNARADGFAIEDIAELLGHTDINCTKIYTRFSKENLAEKLERL